MKIITLEEHFQTKEISDATRRFAERFIMYSVDYPIMAGAPARSFLENAPISPADKEKIAHGNAERLFKM